MTYSFKLNYILPLLELWNEEAPGKYCRTRRDGYDSWGDLVKDQATCQAQCELDSQCIGIAYSPESLFKDWCFICLDDELSDLYGFGFYRRLGITFTVILLYFTVLPVIPSCALPRFQNSFISYRNIYQRTNHDSTIRKTRVYQSWYDSYDCNII